MKLYQFYQQTKTKIPLFLHPFLIKLGVENKNILPRLWSFEL
jgi:hypothetical protein